MGMSPQVQLNNRYRKVTRLDGREVSLDADMIRLLIAIDESKALGQIGRELGMTHATLTATLAKLSAINLIEPIRENIPRRDNGFLDALALNLSRAVGPMAQILLEDALSDMKLSPGPIPQNQAAELIGALALEIPDEEARMQFKRAMLELMKKR
jgi:DNA-binding MarR family transcriptional regulator